MKYIPIWEFCKKYGVPKQNVYRWIRERKISEANIKKERKSVERLVIVDDETIIPK